MDNALAEGDARLNETRVSPRQLFVTAYYVYGSAYILYGVYVKQAQRRSHALTYEVKQSNRELLTCCFPLKE